MGAKTISTKEKDALLKSNQKLNANDPKTSKSDGDEQIKQHKSRQTKQQKGRQTKSYKDYLIRFLSTYERNFFEENREVVARE